MKTITSVPRHSLFSARGVLVISFSSSDELSLRNASNRSGPEAILAYHGYSISFRGVTLTNLSDQFSYFRFRIDDLYEVGGTSADSHTCPITVSL